MKVKTVDENVIRDIGHAFAYYDYGEEPGMGEAFPSREAVDAFICGYVRMALENGSFYATSEKGEGYIAYKCPGEKISLKAVLCMAKAVLGSMKMKDLFHYLKVAAKSGSGPTKQFDREKKPYIFVGMVCVREKYQGQGYMRKVMELAFAEGKRLGVPVILDTDAKSKCDKYMHLGMELAGTRRFGEQGVLYDLIWYPDGKRK